MTPSHEPADMSGVVWRWLGRAPYGPTLALQRAHRAAIQDRSAGDEIWLLEHAPAVFTYGRRCREAPDPPGPERVFRIRRGGLVTWHGPGQLVAYALIDTERRGVGARGLVCALEQGVIDWLSARGVVGGRRSGLPGVWVGDQKICAVGLHLSRGVSMHGLALNLHIDPSGFQRISPCGLGLRSVTWLSRHLVGATPDTEAAASTLGPGLCAALERATLQIPGAKTLDAPISS